MTTKQFKHLLVAYTDTTGGKTWGVLEPGLRSRFPIKELAWNKYLIRQLEITFVDSKDKTVQSLISVDEPHKMPFFYMLILDGDV